MCYDSYISISQTDVEEEIKRALGLDAELDIGEGGGGYIPTLEALGALGGNSITREDFREAAIQGIYSFLLNNDAWLRHKVSEYLYSFLLNNEEQANLCACGCSDCGCHAEA